MIIEGMPFDEYRKDPGINISLLKTIGRSPAHFQWELNHPRKQTDDMVKGSATHTILLEPDKFREQYWILPEVSLATKEGKALKAEGEAKNPGKTMLREEWMTPLRGMNDAVYSNTFATNLLNGAKKEISIFEEWEGIRTKCRLDIYNEESRIIGDIKTCQSAEPHSFKETVSQRGYDLQAAWYLWLAKEAGLKVDAYVIVAVEKEPPHLTCSYIIEDEAIELSKVECKRLLQVYKYCKEKNHWPGYSDSPLLLTHTPWRKNLLEANNGILNG